MRYFYAHADDEPQGPCELAELERLKAEGKLPDTTLVMLENGTVWQPLAGVLEAAKPPTSFQTPQEKKDIKFQCTKCGQHLTVDEAGVGQIVQCPKCNYSLRIPSSSVEASQASEQPATFPFSPPVRVGAHRNLLANQPEAEKKTLHVAIICATALCAVLIMGVCIAIGMSRSNPNGTVVTTANGERVSNYIPAIEAVLKKDHELAIVKKHKLSGQKIEKDEDLDYQASVISEYVTAAREIDLSKCPRDFAEQYWRHISAWLGQAQAIASHPHIQSGGEEFFEGMLRGLKGDWTGGAFEKQAEFKAYAQQIMNRISQVNETWREVEAVAIRYGVKFQK